MDQDVCTRADLIESVVADTGLSKVNATAAVKAFLEAIVWQVQQGKRVVIKEFARFEAIPTAERKGRNLQTGQPMTIPAGKRVSIKAKFPAE